MPNKGGDNVDVIKDYLVSLGFQVNSQSLNQAKDAMNSAERIVTRFAGSSVAQFAMAGAAVTTFVITANAALASFMNRIAQAELANEMFARQMYTSVENASAITNSLNAMGRSFEEIYLSPELMAQFRELRGLSFQLRPPEEFKEQTKNIRSITFEFTKLKMEMTQASQWVFYYLNKYLAPYIEKFKKGMQDLNDSIVKNMPKWTKEIAQVVSWVGRLGVALFTAGQAIYKLFKEMPSNLKVAGSAFLGFFTLLKMGPIGWLIAGITSILLLMDDFTTYKNGGKSAFAGMWEELDGGEGIIGSTKKSLESMGGSLSDILNSLTEIWDFFGGKNSGTQVLKDTLMFIDSTLQSIATGLETIAHPIDKLTESFTKLSKSWDGFQDAGGFTELYEELKKSPGLSQSWGNFQDAGGFSALYKEMFGKVNYNQPRSPSQNKMSVSNVSTFNVYGNDPYATATLVSNNMNSINTRNFKGVIL